MFSYNWTIVIDYLHILSMPILYTADLFKLMKPQLPESHSKLMKTWEYCSFCISNESSNGRNHVFAVSTELIAFHFLHSRKSWCWYNISDSININVAAHRYCLYCQQVNASILAVNRPACHISLIWCVAVNVSDNVFRCCWNVADANDSFIRHGIKWERQELTQVTVPLWYMAKQSTCYLAK